MSILTYLHQNPGLHPEDSSTDRPSGAPVSGGRFIVLILFPVLYALYNEIIFSIFLRQGFSLHKLTFALLEGLFLYWLGQLHRRRLYGFLLQTLFAIIYSLVYGIQLTYYTLFETPFYLKSLGGAGAAMTGFFGVVISSILKVGPALLMIIACFLLWITLYRSWFLKVPYDETRGWRALLCMTAWMVITCSMVVLDYNGATSPSYMFLYEFAMRWRISPCWTPNPSSSSVCCPPRCWT